MIPPVPEHIVQHGGNIHLLPAFICFGNSSIHLLNSIIHTPAPPPKEINPKYTEGGRGGYTAVIWGVFALYLFWGGGGVYTVNKVILTEQANKPHIDVYSGGGGDYSQHYGICTRTAVLDICTRRTAVPAAKGDDVQTRNSPPKLHTPHPNFHFVNLAAAILGSIIW